jgi:hypothetical protein
MVVFFLVVNEKKYAKGQLSDEYKKYYTASYLWKCRQSLNMPKTDIYSIIKTLEQTNQCPKWLS